MVIQIGQLFGDVDSAELLQQAISLGLVWVALSEIREPVGFVWLDTDAGGGVIGVRDIDVLPQHGRRGTGAALLEHACEWARAAGYRRIDLGTLADVRWNAPFYAKHGFVVVDKNDAAFAYARDRDRENGFPDHLRVFMSRPLAAPARDEWTVWPAPAKLNLCLHIVGRRPDGYHCYRRCHAACIDWGDEMQFYQRLPGVASRRLNMSPFPRNRPDRARGAVAAEHPGAVADVVFGQAVARRWISKSTSAFRVSGGLGGGSSDAATVLVALNLLWRLDLDDDELAELGRQLGARRARFVRGHSAWAEGVGEQLTALALPTRHYVVLDPHEPVPTAALFQAPELTRNAPRATISSFVSGETTANAFTPVVRARHPRVATAIDWLGGFGEARLSGSGGCVFLETGSLHRACAVVARCPAAFTARIATGVEVSPLQDALARHRGVDRATRTT